MKTRSSVSCILACIGLVLLVSCQTGENNPEYDLAMASSRGDKDAVVMMIEKGAAADGGESYEGYPLQCALSSSELDIADVLLENGADVNAVVAGDLNLLDWFIQAQNGTDDEDELAGYQVAIDWLYDNGARRPPE